MSIPGPSGLSEPKIRADHCRKAGSDARSNSWRHRFGGQTRCSGGGLKSPLPESAYGHSSAVVRANCSIALRTDESEVSGGSGSPKMTRGYVGKPAPRGAWVVTAAVEQTGKTTMPGIAIRHDSIRREDRQSTR